jgi:acyl phosphate:glycerol-3-phosphate acyltransferase
MWILWCVGAFLAGSLPFSLWVGRAALGTDIRQVGDGNPGATNVFRAAAKRRGGRKWGLLAALLDILKGALPVGLAYYALQLEGLPLILTALAPVAGHAFSPWLGWRGGKAVAVTFGVWAALTLWVVPCILGVALLVWLRIIGISGWAVVLALLAALLYLGLMANFGVLPAVFVPIMLGNLLISAYKHRADLALRPFRNHQQRA